MPSRTADKRVPQNHIQIQLWSLERREWRQSDRLGLDLSNPSLMERVAQKYLWEIYSLLNNIYIGKPLPLVRLGRIILLLTNYNHNFFLP
jgi:hypothetical protein